MAQNPSPPLDRLLELVDAANSLHARDLLGEIRREISSGADVVPWIQAIQIARDLTVLDADAAYFLLDVLTEQAVGTRIDDDLTLRRVVKEMKVIERQAGLGDDEAFLVNEAPVEWQRLNQLWEGRFDALRMELLREHGEAAMGVELLTHAEDYEERSRRGWRMLMAIDDDESPS